MEKLKIKGMHCPSCEMLIKDILEDEGIEVLTIDHKTGDLEIQSENLDIEEVKKLLNEEGYEVEE